MITALDLKTPGREEDKSEEGEKSAAGDTSKVAGADAGDTSRVVRVAGAGDTSRVVRDGNGHDTSKVSDTIVEGVNLNAILEGLGGRENIQTLDNCVTRLRVEVKDSNAINEETLKAAGAKAVVRTGAGSVQVVIGLKVQKVADELRKML